MCVWGGQKWQKLEQGGAERISMVVGIHNLKADTESRKMPIWKVFQSTQPIESTLKNPLDEDRQILRILQGSTQRVPIPSPTRFPLIAHTAENEMHSWFPRTGLGEMF